MSGFFRVLALRSRGELLVARPLVSPLYASSHASTPVLDVASPETPDWDQPSAQASRSGSGHEAGVGNRLEPSPIVHTRPVPRKQPEIGTAPAIDARGVSTSFAADRDMGVSPGVGVKHEIGTGTSIGTSIGSGPESPIGADVPAWPSGRAAGLDPGPRSAADPGSDDRPLVPPRLHAHASGQLARAGSPAGAPHPAAGAPERASALELPDGPGTLLPPQPEPLTPLAHPLHPARPAAGPKTLQPPQPEPLATPHTLPLHPARPAAEPTIHVRIGRVEVRAVHPPAPVQHDPRPQRNDRTLSLDDYIATRDHHRK
jgi:hypothetical protein